MFVPQSGASIVMFARCIAGSAKQCEPGTTWTTRKESQGRSWQKNSGQEKECVALGPERAVTGGGSKVGAGLSWGLRELMRVHPNIQRRPGKLTIVLDPRICPARLKRVATRMSASHNRVCKNSTDQVSDDRRFDVSGGFCHYYLRTPRHQRMAGTKYRCQNANYRHSAAWHCSGTSSCSCSASRCSCS